MEFTNYQINELPKQLVNFQILKLFWILEYLWIRKFYAT